MFCGGIVVVDDEPDIRDSICQLLEIEGYDAYPARDGKEALAVLEKLPRPCLILLDLMMPGMNGWEFLEARKGIDNFAEIPVVVATAGDVPPRPGTANITLKKPVDVEALLRTVQHFCGPGVRKVA